MLANKVFSSASFYIAKTNKTLKLGRWPLKNLNRSQNHAMQIPAHAKFVNVSIKSKKYHKSLISFKALTQNSFTPITKNLLGISKRLYSTSPESRGNASNAPESNPVPKKSFIERLKELGPPGVVLYTIVTVADIPIIYVLLKAGIDIASIMSYFGFTFNPALGTLFVAWAVHKALLPLRVIVVGLTLPAFKPYYERYFAHILAPLLKMLGIAQK